MEGRIKKKIHEIREEIKKKYFRIKHGREQNESKNKKSLAPITDLLNQQLNRMKVEDVSLGDESFKNVSHKKSVLKRKRKVLIDDIDSEEELFKSAIDARVQSTPISLNNKNPSNYSSISNHATQFPPTSNVLVNANNTSMSNTDNDSMMESFLKAKKDSNKWDRVNGPKKTTKGDIKLGDHILLMNADNITLKGVTFKNTAGLRELILKHKPQTDIFDSADLENYKQLLELSNKQITKNNSIKYKTIIKPFLTKGTGLLRSTSSRSKVDYRWWDNPNELVSRLQLLIASTSTGNNSHQNEIVAIIEELREARIIV